MTSPLSTFIVKVCMTVIEARIYVGYKFIGISQLFIGFALACCSTFATNITLIGFAIID